MCPGVDSEVCHVRIQQEEKWIGTIRKYIDINQLSLKFAFVTNSSLTGTDIASSSLTEFLPI